MQVEADILNFLTGVQVLDLQNHRCVGSHSAGSLLLTHDHTADHHLDDLILGSLLGVDSAYIFAVTHNGNAIGDAGNLIHTVRDIDHADALVSELIHDLEQLFHFGKGQSCCGLVQNQQLAVAGNGLGDLNHLLLADGQVAQADRGIDLNAHLVKLTLCLFFHGLVVDQTALEELTANEHVLRYRQVIHHVQFLVDNADTGNLRFTDVAEAHLLTQILDGAAILLMDAAQHLDQCGFTGTVLAHQCVNFAGTQIKIDAPQRMHTGEILLDALHLQNCFAHSYSPFSYHFILTAAGLCPFFSSSYITFLGLLHTMHKSESFRLCKPHEYLCIKRAICPLLPIL